MSKNGEVWSEGAVRVGVEGELGCLEVTHSPDIPGNVFLHTPNAPPIEFYGLMRLDMEAGLARALGQALVRIADEVTMVKLNEDCK